MIGRDEEDRTRFTRRTLMLGGAGLLGFASLTSRLYQLQILESKKYRGLSEENQFNFRLLVPSRGRILDRTGQELATNADNFRLLLRPEQVSDLDVLFEKLSKIINLPEGREAEIRKEFARRAKASTIRIADHMDWETFARVNLLLPELPGIQPEVGEIRTYPEGYDTAHIIGYVGSVPPEYPMGNEPLLRHPGFRIGRTGMERKYDLELRGEPGALKFEVNALGRVIRELPDIRTRAKPGKDIRLSIDKDLQAVAVKEFEGTSGAACVLDLASGEVRALASTPSFDPNKFSRGISNDDYQALLKDKLNPLFNKAIGGSFPPASCFKPVVAMAAMDARLADPKERIHCSGKIELGDRVFHCWRRKGHGNVDLNGAIGVSCDIYFYELARRLGIERIHAAAMKFGFGKLFDLDLGGGSAGLVPTQAWKRARFDLPWAQGETLIAGIGQGYLSATPIQLAVMTARIATGRKIIPTLEHKEDHDTNTAEPLGFSEAAFAMARQGMFSVVNRPWATAFSPDGLDGKGTLWAGKTGTGQVRRITQAERDDKVLKNDELPWEQRDHALFVGFAPFENPELAISVVVEHGGGGASAAAPRARRILKFALEKDRKLAAITSQQGQVL